nr:uncharacterized protein LOC113717808 [Coffea arabica]
MALKFTWTLKPFLFGGLKSQENPLFPEEIQQSLKLEVLIISGKKKMVRVASFFGMAFGAFIFWQTMDKVHVWIALHQDEKQERMAKEAEIKKMREELLRQNRERGDTLL